MLYSIKYTQILKLTVVFITALITHSNVVAEDVPEQPVKALNETEFLGLKLAEANINSVRSHLWDVGGFLQAKSTVKQRNIDKFYPWSSIRDSYYITFEYNHAGNVVSVTRLYRPYSTELNNKRSAITTKEVALKFISEYGQPTAIQTKGWGGSPSYPSYIWENETLRILIDREGSELYGNVFIRYEIKNNRRFEVAEKATNPNA